MERLFIYSLVFISIFWGCKSHTNSNKSENEIDSITVSQIEDAYLNIIGNDIWIREKPTDGEVIMKLNDGNNCKIIEKGKEESIKGVSDFWYKIEFEGNVGWVFGSQTSIKQENETGNDDDIEDEILIKNLINKLVYIIEKKETDNLKKFFYIENKVFVISNPGAYIVIGLREEFNLAEYYPINSVKKTDVVFEKWPEYDFENEDWEKHGCFAEKITEKEFFTKLVNSMKDFGFEPSADEIKYAKELDKVTLYKILVTDDYIRFYIAKKDGKWLITAIDIHDFSA
jgi:hypothetical protein